MAEPSMCYAVVIESHHVLAEGIGECLRQRGYVVGIASTHAGGAAWAASRHKVDVLVARHLRPEKAPTAPTSLRHARAIRPSASLSSFRTMTKVRQTCLATR